MARKLIEIEVEEVSLVDAAANRSKFAIIKRRELMDELIKLLKSLLGDEFTEDSIAKAELPPDQLKAVAGALATLSKFKEDFPADILGAIKSLAKYVVASAPDKTKKSEEMSKEDIEKIGARLSKATLEELKKMSAIIDGIDMKAFKKIKEIVDGLIKSAEPMDKKAYESLPEDVRARLIKLDAVEEEAERKVQLASQAEVVKAAVAEAIKPLQDESKLLKEEVAELKKSKGITKGIKGQEGGDKKEEDKSGFWPSLASK